MRGPFQIGWLSETSKSAPLTLQSHSKVSPLGECWEKLRILVWVLCLEHWGNILHRDLANLSPCLNYGPNQPSSLRNFTGDSVKNWEGSWGRWEIPRFGIGSWVPAGLSLSASWLRWKWDLQLPLLWFPHCDRLRPWTIGQNEPFFSSGALPGISKVNGKVAGTIGKETSFSWASQTSELLSQHSKHSQGNGIGHR